jgi:CBS domain-containing protein
LRPLADDRTVGEVMTREVATVHPETPVHELVELLVHRNYRALPVVDRDGRIAGIVTNADLIRSGGLGVRAELLHVLQSGMLADELQRLAAAGIKAADVMTSEVVTVRARTDLRSAAHLMVSRRMKRLPVVDGSGRVIGIVSRVDILRTVEDQFPAGAGRPAAENGDETLAVPLLVGAAMSRNVPTVDAGATLPEVLDAVVSTRLNRAVVVDSEQRPLGVISDAQLMQRIDPLQQPGVVQVLMSRLPFVRLSPEQREFLRGQTGTRAGDLMIAPAMTVRESTTMIDAIGRMIQHSYKILSVVDDDGRLAGMIDRADLLRAIVAE